MEWNGDNKVKINLMQDWASATPKGGFPYKKKIWTWHLYMHLDMALKMNDRIRFWKKIE